MGTVFSFELRSAPVDLGPVLARLHTVDATFSTYRPDSAISRLARRELTLTDCPADVRVVFDLCAQASVATDGYFCALSAGALDPTGLVKGWAIQQASEALRAAGCDQHSVNGGGDLQSAGGPWRFGVADPADPKRLLAVLTGDDLAVATSGTGQRGAHIVNPFTGAPATELASVTVVGPCLLWADVYATAACAMGEGAIHWLSQLADYQALVVRADGQQWRSRGLPIAPG